ncbi:MAG: 3-phosphoglycerate dehydrogenase [Gammaproteobacteria bacterium]|nr:MAG: 3-phosphoglycerate dehydrogenase [Gammaproteobacteria bacterium]RLA14146.1 MAG: 3-phosphoglycerate dehydrogenase [Gammaproteobacteria bacterium]
MFKVNTLNNISPVGLQRLEPDTYDLEGSLEDAEVVLLRSANMHEMEIPAGLKAVGRAGAGVNNIPVDQFSAVGIPVFNTPGANANAVKELVVAGMLLSARNLVQSWDYTRQLTSAGSELSKEVEAAKKQFAGYELPGRTLGVVGLGAIGRQVAKVAIDLGMKVIGYDPGLTISGAWQLSGEILQAASVDELMAKSDMVTFHVPLNEHTRDLLDEKRVRLLKKGATVLNFAREGIVNNEAVLAALESDQLHAYVCDFPTAELRACAKVISLPHLGASTREAEENCAVMVVDQVREYLEYGNISNSVNFPDAMLPRSDGYRLAVVNSNVPNMVGQIATYLAEAGLNIIDMLNKSRGDLAYTLVDTDGKLPDEVAQKIRDIDGVLSVRMI